MALGRLAACCVLAIKTFVFQLFALLEMVRCEIDRRSTYDVKYVRCLASGAAYFELFYPAYVFQLGEDTA